LATNLTPQDKSLRIKLKSAKADWVDSVISAFIRA
jgi:hypothetical protein